MKDKRVVITGGAGFIGSNLAEELAISNTVVIIDDLSTGKKENIASLLQKDNIKFIEGSILDLKLLQKSFRGIDFVFHQAALPSVPRSIEDPRASNEVNITGTLNVLLAARDNKVKKVIYASSSSVYGDTPTLPKREDMPANPQSPYALTKLVGEYYCGIFHQIYKLPTICLRYFNVYGPRQDPTSQYAAVIPRFIVRVLRGNHPIIYGDGNQTRDFTYVKDVIQANVVATQDETTGIFNIGRGERNSINYLAEIILNIMDKDLQPVYESPLPGDVEHSLADISKAEKMGYRPEYDLGTGLKQTIASVQSL
ncbi:MAG: GDP-mannose 4,6-dehydratase [Dehalococcoidales bacterium]|nr:GDP-mannose 4,6-dehydratase [Dehalococcoidales bacterium]|tara:strand:- start:3173 stop:4105 length:933 start_codon:yes stop_codon:yes gene_type:complete